MRKNLRIAVWHNLPSGGGKRQLYYHVKGLLGRGHYIESWCPPSADQKYLSLNTLIRENIVPLRLFKNSMNKSVRDVRQLLRSLEEHSASCAREINEKGFDILFVNSCSYTGTSPIAKYVKIPCIMYLGEPHRVFYEAMPELPWIAPKSLFSFRFSRDFLRNFLIQKAYLQGIRLQARAELEYAKALDVILVNSLFSRESILRSYNLESKVCYLGIDMELYRPTGERKESFVVGLGSIHYAKGIDRAIKALSKISKEKRPKLIWIGNAIHKQDADMFIALAEELGVFLEFKINIPDKDVVSLLSRALVMIYVSRLEPFGLAPLEANACGTSVVAIAEGGIRESIQDGINGFLIDNDDPILLSTLLSRFIDDPFLSEKMGESCREYVLKKWSIESCIENIESHLFSAIKDRI